MVQKARTSYNPVKSVNEEQNAGKKPKSLAGVESIIKKRVAIDKEIGRRRKMRHQHVEKQPEIYYNPPPMYDPRQ